MKVYLMINYRIITGVCIFSAFFYNTLNAQVPVWQPPFHPANLWMSDPVPWNSASDRVPTSVRLSRDQYFDQLIGYREPLTPETAKGSGVSDGVPPPNQKEIPDLPNRSVLIGTFLSYQPILSTSGRAIYTEVTFIVNSSFEDASGRGTPGKEVVIVVPGGTVTTPQGTTLSFMTQPRPYFINIGRVYLLAMSYHTTGDFFMLGKDWDLTDGVVRANFPLSSKNPTTLVGLDLQQLAAKLNTEFNK